MRLGAVKYVVPFCFVLDPALVGRAPLPEVGVAVLFAIAGVVVMACAFEGYLVGVERTMGPLSRLIALGAGFAVLTPGLVSSLAGLAVAAATALAVRFAGRRRDVLAGDRPPTGTRV